MIGERATKIKKTSHGPALPCLPREVWCHITSFIRRVGDFKQMLMASKTFHSVFWTSAFNRELHIMTPDDGTDIESYSQNLKPFLYNLQFVKIDHSLLRYFDNAFHSVIESYITFNTNDAADIELSFPALKHVILDKAPISFFSHLRAPVLSNVTLLSDSMNIDKRLETLCKFEIDSLSIPDIDRSRAEESPYRRKMCFPHHEKWDVCGMSKDVQHMTARHLYNAIRLVISHNPYLEKLCESAKEYKSVKAKLYHLVETKPPSWKRHFLQSYLNHCHFGSGEYLLNRSDE